MKPYLPQYLCLHLQAPTERLREAVTALSLCCRSYRQNQLCPYLCHEKARCRLAQALLRCIVKPPKPYLGCRTYRSYPLSQRTDAKAPRSLLTNAPLCRRLPSRREGLISLLRRQYLPTLFCFPSEVPFCTL